MKTGIWQILEALSIVWGMYKATKNHGKTIMSVEEWQKYRDYTGPVKQFIAGFVCVIWFLNGPLIAIMGGCHGVWLMAYCTLAFIMLLEGFHKMNNDVYPSTMHKWYRSFLMYAIYAGILYCGGFWSDFYLTF